MPGKLTEEERIKLKLKVLEELAKTNASFADFSRRHAKDKVTSDTRTSALRNKDYWHSLRGAGDRFVARRNNKSDLTSIATDTYFKYPLLLTAGAPAATEATTAYTLGGWGSTIPVILRLGINYLSGAAGALLGESLGRNVGLAVNKVANVSGYDNLGATAGTIGGSLLGYKSGDTVTGNHLRRAIYNNVSPYGYGNADKIGINHPLELKHTLKDFAFPSRWRELYHRTSINGEPYWMYLLKGGKGVRMKDGTIIKHPSQVYLTDNAFGTGDNAINGRTMLLFRDDAWRKAMRLPTRPGHNLYIPNGDGTYSYNMDYVNKVRRATGDYEFDISEAPMSEALRTIAYGDNSYYDEVTGNGGTTSPWVVNSDGSITFSDTWDLQPFKDSRKLEVPLLKQYSISFPETEAVSAVGGEPFKLKHTF